MKNIFSDLPSELKNEQFTELLRTKNIRIERIVSKGHTSPTTGWYDQEENEWVLVLQGAGTILFAGDNQRLSGQTRRSLRSGWQCIILLKISRHLSKVSDLAEVIGVHKSYNKERILWVHRRSSSGE